MNKHLLTIIIAGFVILSAAGAYSLFEHNTKVLSIDTASPDKSTNEDKHTRKKVFNAFTHTLDNGLEIVVIENHRVPVVTHMIWYKIGSADEPKGKSGIAHFLEHLMFKGHSYQGLGTYAPGEFSRIVRAYGGEDNAFTSQDYTAYYQSIAKDHLEEMMRIEAARMKGLNVPEDEAISENKVIQEERKQHTDNNPAAQLSEKMNLELFPVHPYGIPVIGWLDEINKLTLQDAKDFYNRYYVPNNAILVISGDVTSSEAVEMAKRTYGLIPASSAPLPERHRNTSHDIAPHAPVTLEHENVKEVKYNRLYRVPSYNQNSEMSLAFQVLEEIIGSGPTSRLYKSLVINQKLATSISLEYSSIAWDDSIIGISATPSPTTEIDDLRTAIDEQLRLLIDKGITDQELESAVTRLKNDAIFALDSLNGPAMIIGYNMVTGAKLDDIEYWPDMIDKVTAQQVVKAAKLYLNPDEQSSYPPVEGILLPKNETGKGSTK